MSRHVPVAPKLCTGAGNVSVLVFCVVSDFAEEEEEEEGEEEEEEEEEEEGEDDEEEDDEDEDSPTSFASSLALSLGVRIGSATQCLHHFECPGCFISANDSS